MWKATLQRMDTDNYMGTAVSAVRLCEDLTSITTTAIRCLDYESRTQLSRCSKYPISLRPKFGVSKSHLSRGSLHKVSPCTMSSLIACPNMPHPKMQDSMKKNVGIFHKLRTNDSSRIDLPKNGPQKVRNAALTPVPLTNPLFPSAPIDRLREG